ncbi:MAG: hypothetical protein K0Q90_4238, partial [Paenibacillaceae bacterium]|nr:hypothetical protein [Paenibacillaceae bacterium]
GAVDGTKLADGAVDGTKLADGAVDSAKLADGAVDSAKLADGAVDSAKLANGAVDGAKLADGAVDGAVNSTKLANGAVDGIKLAKGAVEEEHLSPFLQKKLQQVAAGPQCGAFPFTFPSLQETCQLEIILGRPFADNKYVLVAMTNHPACYAVLKELHPDRAIIELVRTKISGDIPGVVSWMASVIS